MTQVDHPSDNTWECSVPSHTSANVAGTKITVCSHSGGCRNRSTRPMTRARPRYIRLDSATAPPGLSLPVSASPLTKVPAVRSTKATMT